MCSVIYSVDTKSISVSYNRLVGGHGGPLHGFSMEIKD